MFDLYDIDSTITREKYIKTLYVVLIVILFTSCVAGPIITSIILSVVLESAIYLVILLGLPIYLLIFYLLKMCVAISLGSYKDLIQINRSCSVSKVKMHPAGETNTQANHFQIQGESTFKKTSLASSGFKDNEEWYCEKCGFKNSPGTTECGNCYSKRK